MTGIFPFFPKKQQQKDCIRVERTRNTQLTNDIIPPEYSWNEAILEKNHPLNTGLITLIAYSPDRSPRIIGTAFTISVFGDSAVGITAAHNFDEIEKSQHPRKGHHRSALPEFLPDSQPDLNPKKLTRPLC